MRDVICERGCQASGRRSIARVFRQGPHKPTLSAPKAFLYAPSVPSSLQPPSRHHILALCSHKSCRGLVDDVYWG